MLLLLFISSEIENEMMFLTVKAPKVPLFKMDEM